MLKGSIKLGAWIGSYIAVGAFVMGEMAKLWGWFGERWFDDILTDDEEES